jgi:hypothetical protein
MGSAVLGGKEGRGGGRDDHPRNVACCKEAVGTIRVERVSLAIMSLIPFISC